MNETKLHVTGYILTCCLADLLTANKSLSACQAEIIFVIFTAIYNGQQQFCDRALAKVSPNTEQEQRPNHHAAHILRLKIQKALFLFQTACSRGL